MSVAPAPRKQRLSRSLVLLVPAVLFGLLVTLQWRTQAERSELSVRYNAPLIDAANALQNEQNDLKVQLAQLRARLDEIQRNASSQSGAAKELQTRLDELKSSAGLTPESGDGVVVQLDDARNVSVSARDVDKSICHATDLTDIINTAWKGGAQAIAVNDKFAPAYYELGVLYVHAGKYADAKTNLLKYLELDPNGKDAATAKEMLKYVK